MRKKKATHCRYCKYSFTERNKWYCSIAMSEEVTKEMMFLECESFEDKRKNK